MLENWTAENIFIGQMAKIHNVSPKMLRYWDKIGVLKPAETDKINGYRYYSTQQFHMLNFIVYMRSMGLTYTEIKKCLKNINKNSFQDLLDSQIELTAERIQELETVKFKLENLKRDLSSAGEIQQTGIIKVVSYPENKIISLEGNIKTRLEFEKIIMRLEKKLGVNSHLLVPEVGLLLDRNNFEQGEFDVFSGVYILKEDFKAAPDLIQTLPAGDYVRLYFWGKTEDSSEYFQKMLDYIRERKLEVTGPVMRRVVATGMRMDNLGHMAQILVPIKTKNLNGAE